MIDRYLRDVHGARHRLAPVGGDLRSRRSRPAINHLGSLEERQLGRDLALEHAEVELDEAKPTGVAHHPGLRRDLGRDQDAAARLVHRVAVDPLAVAGQLLDVCGHRAGALHLHHPRLDRLRRPLQQQMPLALGAVVLEHRLVDQLAALVGQHLVHHDHQRLVRRRPVDADHVPVLGHGGGPGHVVERLVAAVGMHAQRAVVLEQDHAIAERKARGGTAVVGDLAAGDEHSHKAGTIPARRLVLAGDAPLAAQHGGVDLARARLAAGRVGNRLGGCLACCQPGPSCGLADQLPTIRAQPAKHVEARSADGGSYLGHGPRTYHQAGGVEKRPPPSSRHDNPTKEDTLKYMLLIHQGTTPTTNSPEDWARLSQDEQQAVYAAYQKINENPGVTAGLGLAPPETATTVRVQDGRTLATDGPFVETKEALGGYLIFEADDLDAAIELAASIPAASMGGAIEVRPVVEW